MTLSKAFARIFWAVAAALVLTSAVFAVITFSSLSGSESIRGSVVRYEVIQNSIPFTEPDSGMQYYPVLRYRDSAGEYVETVSPRPVSPQRYPEGSEVELRRLSDGRAVLNTLMGVWGRPLVFLGTALAFFLFGFGALRSFDSKKY
jgi:hypothetical protein